MADAAWRVTPVGVKHLGVPEQSLACNPCGGYLCVRPLVVYSLADFLTMLRERVEGTAEGFPVSSNGTCDPWLLRGAANRRSRAIEAMHLKLRLLRDAVSEVRAVVHRTGAPLLNLSDSSFRVTLPDEAPGLPRLWNARCVLAHPGEGVRVTVHGSEKAYFRPGPSHTSSVWKPGDVVGRFVSAATNFAVTKARTEREGVVLEGLLRRSTMDLRAHDLVRLIFTWASARYEVWAQVQQVGGGPDVEVTTIPYKDAGLLRDIEGSRTKVECLVMPIVSSPFDLYSLAVLGVFMLLVEDPSRFNKTKVLLENLAERCALLASEDAQAPLEARIARTLASDAGLASFLAQAAPRPIPEDLWLGSIAMLIRALPESGPDSSCANPRDVPAHALHTVFDPLLSDLDRLLAVNLKGSFHWAVAASRSMIPRGRGRIVLLASQAALVSLPSQSAYTASKGAVAALARSLAIDWARHGIGVNAICPTFIWTPMAAPMLEIPEVHQAAVRRIPMGRVGQPRDIGGVVAFLCAPAADLVTGVVLAVDGGWTAGEPELPL